MEPVTLIAAAVAIGASEGLRDTTKKSITDAYAAMRNWIASKYGSVAAEVNGLEQEPDEELRRALLAKKLTTAGAGDDLELRGLAQAFLTLVQEEEPGAPATVGVTLRRAPAPAATLLAQVREMVTRDPRVEVTTKTASGTTSHRRPS